MRTNNQPLRRLVLTVLGLAIPVVPLQAGGAEGVPAAPLFSRHVVPLLSRLGCNAGSCHGAVKGQNGFQLSSLGADPALDHTLYHLHCTRGW